MKLKILIVAISLFTGIAASAQDYGTSIGLRGGLANGITIKHFTSNNMAVEGILSSHFRGFQVTGLAEFHQNAFDTPRLQWFYGVGGHLGFYSYYDGHPWFKETYQGSRAVVGVDGILGLEYSIAEIPICLQVDWKPAFNFVGYSGFVASGGGLSVRYYFN